MKFEAWTAKAVEGRIIEMADTLRMTPAVSGPGSFISKMPGVVREIAESYGYSGASFKTRPSAGALDRMEQCWEWINALAIPDERKLIYAWSWVKVRKGMKISAFAYENDFNDRTLRREITRICQLIANDLNRKHLVRLNSDDCAVSENQSDITTTTVSSESHVNHWRGEGAKPQIDPALSSKRVLDHRAIRARHSDQNRSLGAK